MNELRRPERDIACVRRSRHVPTSRALHIIITDVQLTAAGKGYNVMLLYMYYTRTAGHVIFFPDLADIGTYLILPNGVFDCCETSRAEHPLRPRLARSDEKKLHQNRIHTTFSPRIGL